jgi:predicted permease
VFALGEHALGAGVMLVVVGNIFCFTIGTYIYSGQLSSLEVLKTPMIVAVVVGGAINLLDVSMPNVLLVPINMLGQVAIPLMLFSLGVRLTRASWRDSHSGLIMAVFCPVVGVALALLLLQVFPMSDLHRSILILFGALPPAVINFMLAEQYQTEPDTVASMVLIGNLFAVVSLPIVLYFVLAN